ncbi:hypothetical protein GCM10018954_003950 [Kutzneria kofuensis]
MTHVSVWERLGSADRALVNQLRVLLSGIDPVPREVLAAAASLGQRIASCRSVMANVCLLG